MLLDLEAICTCILMDNFSMGQVGVPMGHAGPYPSLTLVRVKFSWNQYASGPRWFAFQHHREHRMDKSLVGCTSNALNWTDRQGWLVLACKVQLVAPRTRTVWLWSYRNMWLHAPPRALEKTKKKLYLLASFLPVPDHGADLVTPRPCHRRIGFTLA